ncbi:probable pectinesterase 29 [Phalaenopsis equestris]|uniref:probable pectinesterase 29 n=1 Tax=Phalaenopsis equestris TaxID=78828 RepID=UPI0009E1FBB7|nr:probable pectinesterase 29 [Phalaenopsis equestris]
MQMTMKSLLCMAFLLFSSLLLRNTIVVNAGSVVKMVVVDLHGHGDFTSIQKAIDSIPDGNKDWTKIYIKAGVYSEKVNLTKNKGRLVFEGDGPSYTKIQWGDHCSLSKVSQTSDTATFTSAATDVVFKRITFMNTYNDIANPRIAVAMLVSGDKTSFYDCSFVGIQDTLCDLQGRHYFKNCQIVGAVDFIFGFGQSIYERCQIVTSRGLLVPGWVTAHGRYEPLQPTGFVFKNCSLTGFSKVYLGRAWGRYSRVVFYNTFMADIVLPKGWDSWHTPDHGINTNYGEAGCTGPGADTRARVPWEKKLNPKYIQQITSITFIDSEGWLINQGR